MARREFAERYVMLGDDYDMNCLPVGEVIDAIHEIEVSIEEGNTGWLMDWLRSEIEEYDGDPDTQDHADTAKELLNVLMEGDIHE